MTVTQIQDKVRFLAHIDAVDVTDSQLLRIINDEISDQIKFVSGLRQDFLLKAGTAINLVAGTSDYTLATDVFQLKKVMVSDGAANYVAYEKDLNEVTEMNVDTEVASAPKYSLLTQSSATEFIIRLYPTIAANVTNGLTYFYILRPAALTTGTDVPVTPPELHDALVQGCMMALKQRSGDATGMKLAAQGKANILGAYKDQVGTRNIDAQEQFNPPYFSE